MILVEDPELTFDRFVVLIDGFALTTIHDLNLIVLVVGMGRLSDNVLCFYVIRIDCLFIFSLII